MKITALSNHKPGILINYIRIKDISYVLAIECGVYCYVLAIEWGVYCYVLAIEWGVYCYVLAIEWGVYC